MTIGPEPANQALQLRFQGTAGAIKGQPQQVRLATGVQSLGDLQFASGTTTQPAATINRFGKGQIAAVWFSLGQSYPGAATEVLRRFTLGLAKKLVPEPLVEVTGSPAVDVCVARNHGKLLVNLVNTSGPHQSEPIIDAIAPLGPLTVTIRHATHPNRVTLEPGNRPLAYAYSNGGLALTVPNVAIHEVIVVE